LGLAPDCVIISRITFARGSSAMPIGHVTIRQKLVGCYNGSGFADTVESRLLFSFFRAAHA